MSSKTKTTTKNTPYNPGAIDASTNALSGAYGQAQGTIAHNSPALQSAIDRIGQNIASPPKYFTDARTELGKTINGDYLNPSSNPYSEGMAKLIADRTQGNYNATFGASGRSHGGLAALLSGQGVGDALSNFYGNIYNTERGRQQSAVASAPAFNQDEYTGVNELFPAVQNSSMLPLTAANSYAGGTGALLSPYGTQTTTQKQGFNPLTTALGLAGMIGGAFLPMGGAAGGLSSVMQGGGTAGYFAQHPFGSGLGYMPGFGG